MRDAADITELLSAYLSGDLLPEECQAVTRRLGQDPQLRTLAQELTEVLNLLKQGDRQVTPAMVATLQKRLAQRVAEHAELVTGSVLLSASLSGDVDSSEQAALQAYLAERPQAQRELQSLRAVSDLLKKQELPVSAELGDKLLARLKARLPVDAFRPEAAQTGVTQVSVPTSVRIYSTPENPWQRRRAWLALAAAAAIVLTLLGAAFFRIFSSGAQTVVKENRSPEAGSPEVVAVPDLRPLEPGVIDPQAPKEGPQNAPPPTIVDNHAAPQNSKVPEIGPRIVDQTPVAPESPRVVLAPQNVPQPPHQPKVVENPQAPDVQRPAVNPPRNVANGSGTTNGTAVAQGPLNLPGTGTNNTALVSSDPIKQPASDSANDAIASVPNMAVVGAIGGQGQIQARTPNGPSTLKVRDQLPSGTEIVTDQGKVTLVLPQDGRLSINTNSSLVFEFRDKTTVITLNAGEISFQGGPGQLLLAAGSITVTNTKGVDVKLDGNKLIASVTGKGPATVAAKGGKPITVNSGSQAVATLGSDATPHKESISGQPDAWQAELVLPGQTGAGDKIPAADKQNPKKTQSRKR